VVGVRIGADAGVATVRLNRPEQRNALSVPVLEELADAFGDLAVEPSVRAVVLEGAGPDFCAGADVAELGRIVSSGDLEGPEHFDAPFRRALAAIADHPVPVIARVQGRALGGGCQLVLACDLAVAEEPARLGIPSARLGIVIPFDSIERLVLAVGPRRAREMLFAARLVTAEEALAWGLVTRVAPAGALDAATRALVGEVVGAAPLSVRASKRGIAAAVRAAGGGPAEAEFAMMAAEALASRDLAEGLQALRERRDPRFEGA